MNGHSLTRHTVLVFLEYPPVGLNAASSNCRIIGAVPLKSCQDGGHVVLALLSVWLHSRLGSRSIIRRRALESGEDGSNIVLALLRIGLNCTLSRGGVVRRRALESREDGCDIVLALLSVWLDRTLSRGSVLQYPTSVKTIADDNKNTLINTYFRALTLEGSKYAGDIVLTASKTLRGVRVL